MTDNRHTVDRRGFLQHGLAGAACGLTLSTAIAPCLAKAARSGHEQQPRLEPPLTQKAAQRKFLFWDNRGYERVEGFERVLQQPQKHPQNPLFVADRPWEHGNITLYGSVVKVRGRPFQLWYSVIQPPWQMYLAYAESDDGLVWHKPELDVYRYQGQKTNIVFTDDPHGPAVIYDEPEPRADWKYKMVCGAAPTGHVCAYYSGDGIHWKPVRPEPIIGNKPDCPMSLVRLADGSYAAHHRTQRGGRRIGRSESPDFVHWQGNRIVLEPGPADPPQTQMYGMGVAMYGDLEIGTVWIYRTEADDPGPGKMLGTYDAEFTYSRSGLCWHRMASGRPFVTQGPAGAWDCGNLQCASSPVFLPDEIRYYYAASNVRHSRHWELKPGRFGVGMASLKADRFLALVAGDAPAMISTTPFGLAGEQFSLNGDIASGGEARMELLSAEGAPIPGFELNRCLPLTGDALGHRLRWDGQPSLNSLVGKRIRWRLCAVRARIYSVSIAGNTSDLPYWQFQTY